jgi:tRNA (cytidine/uridine-2'-O-)-methyltransferase
MFHVILWQPEIPPNTGNIIRLCANTGATLSLVGPLGFELDEPRLRRAGLDYHEFAAVRVFESIEPCLAALGHPRTWAFSARASGRFGAAAFAPGDALLFGPETRGLPEPLLAIAPPERRLAIPMRPGNRSLNLSNAVAVAVYEAWRQQGFAGADGEPSSGIAHPAQG